MLLQKNEYHITLEREAPKILKICPAIDGTFVYITTCRSPPNEEKLVHINAKGQIIWEKAYRDSIDTFGMLNQRDVIVLNVTQAKIDIIDLSNHTIRSTPHRFTFDDTSYMQIYTFYDTRFLCVQQSGKIGEGKLILSYYRYGNNTFQQIAEYRSQEGEWLYGQNITKANNHSKIAWWKSNYTDQIQFSFYDLRAKPEGALSKVKCRNTMAEMYKIQNVTVCIGSLWESQPDKYTIVCNTNGGRFGAFRKVLQLDSVLGTIKRQPIEFESMNSQQFNVFDFINLGQFSVFFTQKMNQGKAIDSKIHYFHNEKQKEITVEIWKATSKSHFYLPGYDPNLIIQAQHDNGNVKEVKVITKRMMTVVQMYLHFLLHQNEDFDDDLLQDALQIMGEI